MLVFHKVEFFGQKRRFVTVWIDNLPFHILNFDIFIEVQMKKRQALRLSLNTAPSRGQKSYSFSNKTRQVDGNSGILHQQI